LQADETVRAQVIAVLGESGTTPLRMSEVRERLEVSGLTAEMPALDALFRDLRAQGVITSMRQPGNGKRCNRYSLSQIPDSAVERETHDSEYHQDIERRVLRYLTESPIAKLKGIAKHLKLSGPQIGPEDTVQVLDELVVQGRLVALPDGFYCTAANESVGRARVAAQSSPRDRTPAPKRAPHPDTNLPGAHVTKVVKPGNCQHCGEFTQHLLCITDTYGAKYLCDRCIPAAKRRIQKNEKQVWYHEIPTGMGKK